MINDDFELYHYLDKTIRSVRLHHHDFYEIYFLISGEVDYYIEGEIHHLNSGDLVLIDTTELHQVKISETDNPYERIVMWIKKSYLNELSSKEISLLDCFENKNKSIINLRLDEEMELTNIFQKLLDLTKNDIAGSKLLKRAYITELMVKINNLEFYGNRKKVNDFKKSKLIDEMIEYIGKNLSERLTIDCIADRFHLSKYYLSREFKKYMNISIYQYIIMKRLIEAKKLILNNEAISDVYIKCGFGDYSNFFKAFKKEYGVTPKEFYNYMIKKSM